MLLLAANSDQQETDGASLARERRSGRPRVIPEALIQKVVSLHRQGFGYRAIARELLRQDGILVAWSTVRRIIKSETRKNA